MNQISDVVKVKNAIFIQNGNIFSVIHYNTEILRYDRDVDKLIICLRNISQSSTRAINQACQYLHIVLDNIPRNLGEDLNV